MCPEYGAGLFDGEGYFTLRRVRGRNKLTSRAWRYQAYAQITMRERWLLKEFIDLVGAGALSKVPSRSKKHSPYFMATWCGSALPKFLDVIQPHLSAKIKQATAIREVVELKSITGNQPITTLSYKRQTLLWARMRKLNMKGVGK